MSDGELQAELLRSSALSTDTSHVFCISSQGSSEQKLVTTVLAAASESEAGDADAHARLMIDGWYWHWHCR